MGGRGDGGVRNRRHNPQQQQVLHMEIPSSPTEDQPYYFDESSVRDEATSIQERPWPDAPLSFSDLQDMVSPTFTNGFVVPEVDYKRLDERLTAIETKLADIIKASDDIKKSRKRRVSGGAKIACANCRKYHEACSHDTPCKRCAAKGLTCIYRTRKAWASKALDAEASKRKGAKKMVERRKRARERQAARVLALLGEDDETSYEETL